MAEPYVTIVEGKSYALGGVFEIDGFASWVSPGATGYAPVNCYLLTHGGCAMLVDTGLPVHERAILDQLGQLVGDERSLSIFYTRVAEFDSMGNGGAVSEAFPVDVAYAHFDAHEWLYFQPRFEGTSRPTAGGRTIEYRIIQTGASISICDGDDARVLDVVHAPLRLLATAWVYDRETRTLFTSDSFGHVTLDRQDGARLVDESNDPSTFETVREHLFTKFDWLNTADTTRLRSELAEIFESRDIEAIAPIYGCVIRGRDLVARHYEWVQEALAQVEVAA